jgi:pimeloyl-ACP methyl ester carboxylesterase
VGPVSVTDGTSITVAVDRAYGPLADDAGHLRTRLIGGSVAATSDLQVAPGDGQKPGFAVAVNQVAVPGEWQPVSGRDGVWHLAVPTTVLLFPKPGDANHALTPRANSVTLSGALGALNWLRFIVPGTPPALLMAGMDFSCDPPGITNPTDTWNDWGRWLTRDGVEYAAPDRDGHVGILDQIPALDNGYAMIRRVFGPDRPGITPRITLVGYSMGGLVARAWAVQHPGIITQFMTIATPNAGTDAATNFFAVFLTRCAAGALHDLAPDVVSAFNVKDDLSSYWSPDPATLHVTSVALVPATGERTDGIVPEESALALPYAIHFTWTQDPNTRTFSLHAFAPHVEQIYTQLRDWTQFATPMRDIRTQ